MAMQSGGMTIKDVNCQSKIATDMIMRLIESLLKSPEFTNKEIPTIRDFYWKLYEKYYNQKPVWHVKHIHIIKTLLRAKPNDLEMSDWINQIKAAIYVYLFELKDDFIEYKLGHSLSGLFSKIDQCRRIVKEKFSYFNLTEQEYYKKYVNDVCVKLDLPLDKYGTGTTNRESNQEPA